MKEILQSVVDAIEDLVFVKDTNFVYLACNESFCSFIGRSSDQIIGHTDDEWFDDPDVLEGFRSLDRKLFSSGTLQRIEEWVTYPDGKRFLLDTIKYPLRDDQKNIIALVGISRDITLKRQAEDEIKLLQGILPLCSFCKKIRDDEGYWEQVDIYIHKYSQADISHSICPECVIKHYPE